MSTTKSSSSTAALQLTHNSASPPRRDLNAAAADVFAEISDFADISGSLSSSLRRTGGSFAAGSNNNNHHSAGSSNTSRRLGDAVASRILNTAALDTVKKLTAEDIAKCAPFAAGVARSSVSQQDVSAVRSQLTAHSSGLLRDYYTRSVLTSQSALKSQSLSNLLSMQRSLTFNGAADQSLLSLSGSYRNLDDSMTSSSVGLNASMTSSLSSILASTDELFGVRHSSMPASRRCSEPCFDILDVTSANSGSPVKSYNTDVTSSLPVDVNGMASSLQQGDMTSHAAMAAAVNHGAADAFTSPMTSRNASLSSTAPVTSAARCKDASTSMASSSAADPSGVAGVADGGGGFPLSKSHSLDSVLRAAADERLARDIGRHLQRKLSSSFKRHYLKTVEVQETTTTTPPGTVVTSPRRNQRHSGDVSTGATAAEVTIRPLADEAKAPVIVRNTDNLLKPEQLTQNNLKNKVAKRIGKFMTVLGNFKGITYVNFVG